MSVGLEVVSLVAGVGNATWGRGTVAVDRVGYDFRALRGGMISSSGIVVSSEVVGVLRVVLGSGDVVGGLPLVLKACAFCSGCGCGGCLSVVGPIENVGPANEVLSFSWPPKNPDGSL